MLAQFWSAHQNPLAGPGQVLRQSIEAFLAALRKQGKVKEVGSTEEALAILTEHGLQPGGRNRRAIVDGVASDLNICDCAAALEFDEEFLKQAQQLLSQNLEGDSV